MNLLLIAHERILESSLPRLAKVRSAAESINPNLSGMFRQFRFIRLRIHTT
jgi:hypothetical protein